MKNVYLLFAALACISQSYAQGVTQIYTNSREPGVVGPLYPYNSKLYYTQGVAPAASGTMKQEWVRFDPATSTVTQLTSDHNSVQSGGTAFRPMYRFGNQVFYASSKYGANTYMNLEYSRFDLSAGTESWLEKYPGVDVSNNNYPYSSDPYVFRAAPDGKVYFPMAQSTGTQLFVWDPASPADVTPLVSGNNFNSANGGFATNSMSSAFVINGNKIMTCAWLSAGTGYAVPVVIDRTNPASYSMNNSGTKYFQPNNMTLAGNKVFFDARISTTTPGTNPRNLVVYDFTTQTYTQLTNYSFTQADGNFSGYFIGNDGNLYINVGDYNNDTHSFILKVDVATNAVSFVSANALTTAREMIVYSSGSKFAVATLGANYSISINKTYDLAAGTYSSIPNAPTFYNWWSSEFYAATNGKLYFNAYVDPDYINAYFYSLNLNGNTITQETTVSAGGYGYAQVGTSLYFIGYDANWYGQLYKADISISGVLPVHFASFTVRKEKETALLNWATASESGIRHYVVERSVDGRLFTEVARVPARNQAAAYEWTDVQLPSAARVYYRIKAIEEGLDAKLSDVRFLNLQDVQPAQYFVFPNPSYGNTIRIATRGDLRSIRSLRILNQMGQELARYQASQLATGSAQSLLVPVGDLPRGSYYILVDEASGTTQRAAQFIR